MFISYDYVMVLSKNSKFKSTLKIGSLNINGGFTAKCESDEVIDLIRNHDLFSFQETFLMQNDACPTVRGYTPFRSERSGKNKKATRNSGGMVVYCRNEVAGGVHKMKVTHQDIMWLKLDKYFFGLECDMYLCVMYISPETSSIYKSNGVDKYCMFEILQTDLELYSSKGIISIMGDLNSRINQKQPEQLDINVNNNNGSLVNEIVTPERHSEDKSMNSFGRKLLSTLTNYDLIVANGCTVGDRIGRYTCEQKTGSSVVELFIIHRDFINKIAYMKVNSFDWYSDHAPITVLLKVNIDQSKNMPKYWKKISKLIQRWDDKTKDDYMKILASEEFQKRLDDFCLSKELNSNSSTEIFTEIIRDALRRTFPVKVKKKRITKENKKSTVTNTPDCRIAKSLFKQAQRAMNLDKSSLNRRHIYMRQKKRYKEIKYRTIKIVKQKGINSLAKIECSDPRTFWQKVKEMTKPSDNAVKHVDPNKWSSHFRSLFEAPLSKGPDKQFLEYVNHSLPLLENISEQNIQINKDISETEIQHIVKHVKFNKSTYLDDMSNEALKLGYESIKKGLIHLFNTVLSSGDFPKLWNESLIIPLHKKGNRLDPNNYRGIAISSCLGKIFLKIITNRIEDYMSTNKKWCVNQCGFKKDHRTEDNLFVLKTVFDSYVGRKNKKVFIAFIDFSKFFDKINRQLLKYKLIRYGITGRVYQIIRSMYDKTMYSLDIDKQMSPWFTANNGVKQGCVLSPLLSNLFQNDLHDIFNQEGLDPIKLGEITFNSISWADDLILISDSENGLQGCLNKLNEYCDKWGLEVNVDKTKFMVMAKRECKKSEFKFGQYTLKQVRKFNYLGFSITDNGSFSSIIEDRACKANRTASLIRQAFRTTQNVNVKLMMSIFDKQILPILLYGSVVWSVPQTHNLLYIINEVETDGVGTRNLAQSILDRIADREIPLVYARRVGKKSENEHRKILVKVRNYDDLEEIIRSGNESIEIYQSPLVTSDNKIEKVHIQHCKKAIGISKYAGTTATLIELGRLPIIHKAHGLAIKYWLRLREGTSNIFVNNAYTENKTEYLDWYQSIQSLLCINGFRNVWEQGSIMPKTFHKVFVNRLNDQFIQGATSKINESERYPVLNTIGYNYQFSSYLNKITCPDIRTIFTKIRLDFNALNESRFRINMADSPACRICNEESEDINHLLFRCSYFNTFRTSFLDKMRATDMRFLVLPENYKLKYILNMECPEKLSGLVCNFVSNIYNSCINFNSEENGIV